MAKIRIEQISSGSVTDGKLIVPDGAGGWKTIDVPTGSGTGDMEKSTYDTDENGVVDKAEAIDGVDTAGNSKYYGTDPSGAEGFHDLPSASGAPTDAKYLLTAANASLSAEVVIPGLAGSPDVSGAAGAGSNEEYDTSTTGLTWSPSTPATVNSNTTHLNHLYVQTTDTTERIGAKAWSPAGAFDARCKVDAGMAAGSFGFHIGNSDNSVRLLITAAFVTLSLGGSDHSVFQGRAYTYASGSYTGRGIAFVYPGSGYFRITRDANNNVSFYWSGNGKTWNLINTVSFSITVANIGFRSSGGAHEAAVDWLRTNV